MRLLKVTSFQVAKNQSCYIVCYSRLRSGALAKQKGDTQARCSNSKSKSQYSANDHVVF